MSYMNLNMKAKAYIHKKASLPHILEYIYIYIDDV